MCSVDVISGEPYATTGNDLYSTTNGIVSTMIGPNKTEALRYHSYTGQTEILPLFHLDPFNDGADSRTIKVLTLDTNTELNECSWCCRKFPDGMLYCCDDAEHRRYTYYCNIVCQSAARKVHKEICTRSS